MFERIYQDALGRLGRAAPDSGQMEPLLRRFYEDAVARPVDLLRVQHSLINLLAFLASSEGRTDANCRVVHAFVRHDGWERSWEELPEALSEIISDMGMGLHDTFSHPILAADFGSTPEQLLARVRALTTD